MRAGARGRVTDYAGGPFQPGRTSILATNGRVHDAMMRVLAEIAARPRR